MKAPSPSTPAVGYLRVSTERQAGEHQSSLADQEAAILDLATRLGVRVGSWYRDAGASGASIEARPAFRQLIADCEAGPQPPRRPGLVLVLNDSRFGRFPDPDEAAAIRFRLKESGWHVRFAEGDDVQDITFRSVIRSLGSAQASEYRRNIQRNARRGRRGASVQGFWTGREPIGYRRKVVAGGPERVLGPGQRKASTEKVRLTPDEEEAGLVRWIFESYASGEHSLGSLAEELKERRPDRRWSRTVVQHLLRNPAYVGDVVGGKRPADPDHAPEEYGCRDAHPAIISRELFAAAAERLTANARKGRAVAATYLLSGIMRCAYCGQHYTGGGAGAKRRENNRFYRDRGGIDGVCDGKIGTVMRHLIDPLVIREIGRVTQRKNVAIEIERAVDEAIAASAGNSITATANARKRRKAADAKRGRLVSAIASGLISQEEAAGELEKIRAEIEDATAILDASRFAGRRSSAADEDRERLLQVATDFPALAERLEGPALRSLVEPWLEGALFDKKNRILTLEIRRVPGLHLYGSPGQVVQMKTTTRRIHVLTGKRVAAP